MKNNIKSNELSLKLLKNEVEEALGKNVNSSGDCHLLSEEVFAKISFKVNSNTLRRFFGLVKSPYNPSPTTLNILSKYCGFESYHELITLKQNAHQPGSDDPYSTSILTYIVSLFKYSPVEDYNDKTFATVVKITMDFLLRHPQLIDKFQRAISKTKNGQDFYYEQFIHIDGLNSFYGKGLRYYLIEKNTAEAQVFGHSLLCFKCWMSENDDGVKRHYAEVTRQHLPKSNNPFLCGLVFTVQLLNAHVKGLSIEKILIKAHQVHSSFKQKKHEDRFSHYFEYIISPVLLLTGHPYEALFYINYSLHNYPKMPTPVEESLYESMNLIKALILAKVGRKAESEELYIKIQPSKFHFLTKKISAIFYLFLTQYLKGESEKSIQQLKELVAETGFTKLQWFYSEPRYF